MANQLRDILISLPKVGVLSVKGVYISKYPLKLNIDDCFKNKCFKCFTAFSEEDLTIQNV